MHDHAVLFAPCQMVWNNFAERPWKEALVNALNGRMDLLFAGGNSARGISRVAHVVYSPGL